MTKLRKHRFPKRIESVQYKAALAIKGAINVSSLEKLYQELGQEYLYQKKMGKKIVLTLNIVTLNIEILFFIKVYFLVLPNFYML